MLPPMPGIEVFCERCGTRQPSVPASDRSKLAFARRLLTSVNRTTADGVAAPVEDTSLRLCLGCRGYSCVACWNEAEGVCQTCVPMAEPVIVAEPEAPPEPVVVAGPEPVIVAEPEPVVVAEPEPVVVAEPEPVVVAEPVDEIPWPVAAPVEASEPEYEPALEVPPQPLFEDPTAALPVAAAAPSASEPETVAEPVAPAEPEPAPPVRPHVPAPPAVLPPLPPPAEPPVRPTITFDVPPPPAFVIAQQATQPAMLSAPTLPPQAVEQPQPTIRPCRNCQLALSARAHFCRRCGSRQD
jgi:hypothetical protein